MTTTRSKVTRKTERAYSVLFPKPREIVCSIAPGDVLEFRESGRRQVYRMAISTGFKYAVQLTALKISRRIAELRKAGISRKQARQIAEREFLK